MMGLIWDNWFDLVGLRLWILKKSGKCRCQLLQNGDKTVSAKTFNLHDEQAAIVEDAITLARTNPIADTGLNETATAMHSL